ncbi:S-methyl-5-thioribose kinase [Arenibaculum pallidiluteum]|uniref:S-methyl-5-thioribose kinase n=1 Tax=Arenibaculum pallidiluteum TaxID=2812559 RepID=UPI001A95D06E|nr:S-methyl-5-thioribose kinase [Arenibaculum pallidiluteum]
MDETVATQTRYRAMSDTPLRQYLAGLPEVRALLGGGPEAWTVREVGDGNLNLVFIVSGPAGGVAVKQALPYVRLVGESWPLPLTRAFFEHEALSEQARWVPDLVPRVLHFDADLALIVMSYLTPHVILRKGLIHGTRYPRMAEDMARFLAETLFRTSDLHCPAAEKKARMALFCGNTALCRITEDLVFTDPYREAPLNRWTRPQLDGDAAALRADGDLRAAAQRLKLKFLTSAEALVHGDLHTGSVMATDADTRVIDPEFAFYGPMGFDVGAFLANLLLAFLAQSGHEERRGERDDHRAWLLDQVEAVWTGFEARFRELWLRVGGGDAFDPGLFADEGGSAALAAAQDAYMAGLLADSLGFAGCKMIRRILGLAHVEDMESIADPDRRAACERQALALGRLLVVRGGELGSIRAARQAAERIAEGRTP